MFKIYIKQFLFYIFAFSLLFASVDGFDVHTITINLFTLNTLYWFSVLCVPACILAFIVNSKIKYKKVFGLVLLPIIYFLFIYVSNFYELYSGCITGITSSFCFNFKMLFIFFGILTTFSTVLFLGFSLIYRYSKGGNLEILI